jgi:hypothetical protein
MDLRLLRYFVAVAQERHFGRAAARLHMSQPPLSRAIKQLEADLGAVLLHRSATGVTLTAAGELLYDEARTLLEQLRDGPVVRTISECLQGTLWNGTVGMMPMGHALPEGLTCVRLGGMSASRLVLAWNSASAAPLIRSFTRIAAANYRLRRDSGAVRSGLTWSMTHRTGKLSSEINTRLWVCPRGDVLPALLAGSGGQESGCFP